MTHSIGEYGKTIETLKSDSSWESLEVDVTKE